MKKIVLAIGAHPDDIEIGCGGTLSLLHSRGYEIVHLVITSGEEGDISKSKSSLAQERELEASRSAKILGASKILFFREPDGLTSFSKELKVKLVSVIREIRPEIIFTHAASDQFPDHKIVHRLTRDAVTAAGGPWYAEAGGDPHTVKELYGYEVWTPISDFQLCVDVSSTFSKKLESLMAHTSQVTNVRYLEAIKGLAMYRGAMTMTGEFAEVFEILKSTGAIL